MQLHSIKASRLQRLLLSNLDLKDLIIFLTDNLNHYQYSLPAN